MRNFLIEWQIGGPAFEHSDYSRNSFSISLMFMRYSGTSDWLEHLRYRSENSEGTPTTGCGPGIQATSPFSGSMQEKTTNLPPIRPKMYPTILKNSSRST